MFLVLPLCSLFPGVDNVLTTCDCPLVLTSLLMLRMTLGRWWLERSRSEEYRQVHLTGKQECSIVRGGKIAAHWARWIRMQWWIRRCCPFRSESKPRMCTNSTGRWWGGILDLELLLTTGLITKDAAIPATKPRIETAHSVQLTLWHTVLYPFSHCGLTQLGKPIIETYPSTQPHLTPPYPHRVWPTIHRHLFLPSVFYTGHQKLTIDSS